MIKSIEIKNIRGLGISDNKFFCNVQKNVPSFFVAPNGFGKSSIAKAFNCLANRNRIDIKTEDKHFKNEDSEVEIVIEIDSMTLVTNSEKNEILKHFDIKVINNPVYPKVRKRKTATGFDVQTADLRVPDITFIDKIPEKRNFDFYKVTELRKSITNVSNKWENLHDILENKIFIVNAYSILILLNKSKKLKKMIAFLDEQIILNEEEIEKFDDDFKNLLTLVQDNFSYSKIESGLIALQILHIFLNQKEDFEKAILFYQFTIDKDFIDSFFTSNVWAVLKPKENNVLQKKSSKIDYKSYGIVFPNANDVSNGERDVAVFLSNLINAYLKLNRKKENFILIIDEVFDYLDDSNLIIVQYFLNIFIEKCKSLGVNIYPILLTHLDTYYFSNYAFKKFDVFYLNKWKGQKDSNIENLVILRNRLNKKDDVEKNIYNTISKSFLHFHPDYELLDKETFENALTKYKCQSNSEIDKYRESKHFKLSCLASLENYANGRKNYDPISLCISLRVAIEEIIYNSLSTDTQRTEFLEQNETIKKLKYAEDYVDVPTEFYLLGTIYNEVSHIKNNQDNNSRLFLKLDNQFIKGIIKKIYYKYKNM